MSLDALLCQHAPARVPVVLRVGGADLDLELAVPPAAAVADVLAALAGGEVAPGTALVVDGRAVAADEAAGDAVLRPGSLLELRATPARPATTGASPAAVARLRVTGGIGAGSTVALAPGRHVAGAGPDCDLVIDDPTVSARHLEVTVDPLGSVTVADLGSSNGTRVDGRFATGPTVVLRDAIVEVGAVQLALEPVEPAPTSPRAGLVTFNRPPRPAPPAPPEPVAVPEQPPAPAPRSRLAWMAMLAPMAMGGVMAALWGPRMALFALFTPVMVLGSWADDRRRARKDGRRTASELAADVARFRRDLAERADEAIERRRTTRPDPAEVVARATGLDTRLWERRPGAADFLQLRVGTGPVPWRPPLAETGRPVPAPGVAEALAAHAVLVRAPHDVDLRPGHTLGVVGDRPAVESLLRSLVIQAATLHGPADVRLAILTDADRAAAWSWAKWLPHTQAAGEAAGVRLLATDDAERSTVLAALVTMAPPPARGAEGEDDGRAPARLVIADADGLTEGRPSPVRALLGGAAGPVAGIVVASDVHRLPARCTTVLEIDADGVLSTFEPATNQRVDGVLVAGLTAEAAAEAARSLAGVEDPEVREVGASLPDRVSLLSLLGMEPTAANVLARWRETGEAPALRAPIGVTEDGPLVLDLVADGPHGLLGGTTGSGKSELLRTLVAGLAASTDPDHLTFVLVDYKGGSAFDACARLPHTVGLVTDLDEHLGERALRCLEAELRHRESMLRSAGARDLPHYLTLGRPEPLPRLVVVIDEFATLATELPDFIDALVGIAQRGRSLGVHLVLATQRPAGVVKDNIRANTDLRIALRMQDAADSADVIDSPAAAAVGRRQAGRGYVRRGPGDTVPFQAAIVSTADDGAFSTAVAARPFAFGPEPVAAPPGRGGDAPATDLDRLVDAIREATAAAGIAPPRRPWPDPLPATITLADVDPCPPAASTGDAPHAVLGLADDPARQRRTVLEWDGADGCLLLCGIPGSGTTTALDTLVRSLARRHAPDDLHVYVLDHGVGDLARLARLPHVGAVITAAEDERTDRLLRHLRGELHRRRQARAAGGRDRFPSIVVLIDGWSGFAAAGSDLDAMERRDEVSRLVADGPALGVWTVITADTPTAVPLALANLIPAKLVFRLADRHDHAAFGLSTSAPPALPGRALDTRSGLEVQVALAGDIAPRSGRPAAPEIATLAADVRVDDLPAGAIGIGDDDLTPRALPLRPGDGALVTGPARSGRSTALCTIAAAFSATGWAVTALAPRPTSPLRTCASVRLVASVADLVEATRSPGRHLLLVDDADTVDDPLGDLAAVIAGQPSDVHLVASARSDGLRAAYGHWARELRRSRLGIALRPEADDGDLFGTTFPRRARPAANAGRGYLVVDGAVEVVQVAR